MTAQELRIGNYMYFDGRPSLVKEIDEQGVVVFIKETDEEEWIDLFQFTPIPLTEEILLKCGFVLEDQMYKYFTHKDIPGIFQLFDGVAEYSIDSNDVCWVNNLHQLQNLFYSINGQELKIEI